MRRIKSKKEEQILGDIRRVGAEKCQFVAKTPHEKRDDSYIAALAEYDRRIEELWQAEAKAKRADEMD